MLTLRTWLLQVHTKLVGITVLSSPACQPYPRTYTAHQHSSDPCYVMIFQTLYDSMSYSFHRCPLKIYKIKKEFFDFTANQHTDVISCLPCGSVTSSAMMEKKAFSSSRLCVFSFLTYSATTSITSFRMILDVYCSFFLPVSICSRSVSSRLAIISRIAQKFPLLDDVLDRSSLLDDVLVRSSLLDDVLVRSSLLDDVLVRSSLWPQNGKFVFHKMQLFLHCSIGRERFSCTSSGRTGSIN